MKLKSYSESKYLLEKNKIGLMACDTLWGLVGVLSDQVLERMCVIKNRPKNQPFIILVDNLRTLKSYTKPLKKWQEACIKSLTPGPITLILERSDDLSANLTANKPTVAIRIPKLEPLQDLLSRLNQPLVSTSANLSGVENPLEFKSISSKIIEQVDFVCGEDHLTSGKASIILDITKEPIRTLRS